MNILINKENSIESAGQKFIDLIIDSIRDAIQNNSLVEAKLGDKHPKTLGRIGLLLDYVYKISTCFWGCDGGDHIKERLLGKVVNNSMGCIALYKAGYYDEALNLIRSIGEIANLIALFSNDETSFNNWKSLDDRERYANYKPSKVRLLLEASRKPLPMDKYDYGLLCEIATHVTPSSIPGQYNPKGIPVLGILFQDVGSMVVVNELALILANLVITIPKFINKQKEQEADILRVSAETILHVGTFNIKNYKAHLERM